VIQPVVVAPARVLVMGAGVAGLQAIATARRLGAVVEATDVRSAAKEEVRSLGATFVEIELEAQEGEGGYASEQSEEFLTRQRELIAQRVEESDLVVTTAAEATSADLLVIGRGSTPRAHGHLPTNAYAIVRQSTCPVVTI